MGAKMAVNTDAGERSTRWFPVDEFGAKPDGQTPATKAFADAVAACVSAGGGTVYVPPGTFLSGPIRLESNVTLYLEAGATVRFSRNPDDFPIVFTRWAGFECYAYSPCIFADGAENVALRGAGVLDGQGESWWHEFRELKAGRRASRPRDAELAEKNSGIAGVWDEWDSQFLRPALVQFKDCTRVRIDGTTHRNSPFWNTHILYCCDVVVTGATFENPYDAPNADGLDIDSSRDVRVENCLFDVGDDCLCLKSGINEDGRRVGKVCENVVVSNCIMRHGHGGVVCGSDSAAGIRRLSVTNCIFTGTERGFRVKSNRQRGGFVEDVVVSNIIMHDVGCPLTINDYYVCGVSEADAPSVLSLEAQPVTDATPRLRNLRMTNVVARGAKFAGFVAGLPEAPVEGLVVDGYQVGLAAPDGSQPAMAPASLAPSMVPATPMLLQNLRNCRFRGVEITGARGVAVDIDGAQNLQLTDLQVDGEVHVRNSDHKTVRIESVGTVPTPGGAGSPAGNHQNTVDQETHL